MKSIPDLFTFFDGKKVKSHADWLLRRQELADFFVRNVYGEYPPDAEDGFTFTERDESTDRAIIKRVTLEKDGYSAQFSLFLPPESTAPPVLIHPILKSYENKFNLTDVDDYTTAPNVSAFPIGYILDRGYAVAAYYVTDAAPDEPGGETKGINRVLIPHRTPASACAIAAWSMFAKLIAKYLIGSGYINPDRIGICGHSRGGKTALLTAATSERFAFALVNNSGCTGAAIVRGNTGETIADICHNFPHWFTPIYKEYANREGELPVDFHGMLALVAPRLLYITSSSRDEWACPKNEFLSARLASEVYSRVYEEHGLVAPNTPSFDTPYHEGNLAYHVKTGDHSLAYYDWKKCLDFLDKHGWTK